MEATRDTPDTPLLSVREAARRLNVSVPHVYRLVRRGALPALRVGDGVGPIRIPEDELLGWLYGPEQTR